MTSFNAACRRWLQWVAVLLLVAASLAQAHPNTVAPTAQRPSATHEARTVLVMGDSLSAGLGLEAGQGWVPLTAQRMALSKPGWRLVNASISGETTSGGAARVIDAVVRLRPAIVVIELGANDGLRGLSLRQSRHNLAYMIGAAQGIHARVLLIGMRLPPNYGPDYTRQFEGVYSDLAQRFHTAFVPFLLAPIMREPNAFQADNMHPVARVQPLLRDHVWTTLGPMLD
ncbi:MAG: GDSL-like Lipase/Acylhydrolase family protein [Xanthomonadaceae bacterium]|nr:GDSL-like Lipase/Acylhydrolase family protein [Xanthomonadaceae bacterium]